MTAPISYPFNEDGVAEALTSLGDSADQVAAALTAGGYRGEVDVCWACPVARFLGAVIEADEVEAEVGDEEIRVRAVWPDVFGVPERFEVRIATPDAVGDFVYAFDAEEYPNLIEEDAA